jgi:hypothetical protein
MPRMIGVREAIAREFRFDVLGQLPGCAARSLTRSEIDAEAVTTRLFVPTKTARFRPGTICEFA